MKQYYYKQNAYQLCLYFTWPCLKLLIAFSATLIGTIRNYTSAEACSGSTIVRNFQLDFFLLFQAQKRYIYIVLYMHNLHTMIAGSSVLPTVDYNKQRRCRSDMNPIPGIY